MSPTSPDGVHKSCGRGYALLNSSILSFQVTWLLLNIFNYFYAIPNGTEDDLTSAALGIVINVIAFAIIYVITLRLTDHPSRLKEISILSMYAAIGQVAIVYFVSNLSLDERQWITFPLNAAYFVLYFAFSQNKRKSSLDKE